MLHKFSSTIHFQDVNGDLQAIAGCPEARIPELRELLTLIDEFLTGRRARFSSLYRGSYYLRQLCTRAIALVLPYPARDTSCGPADHWRWIASILSVDMVAEFVCSIEWGGQIHPSLIERVCFPVDAAAAETGLQQISWERRRALVISSLITVGLAADFEGAWEILERLPPAAIDELIDERRAALDPKARERKEFSEFAGEIAAETAAGKPSPFKNFFADFPLHSFKPGNFN